MGAPRFPSPILRLEASPFRGIETWDLTEIIVEKWEGLEDEQTSAEDQPVVADQTFSLHLPPVLSPNHRDSNQAEAATEI